MAKANKQADREKCKVLTPEFRASYPHLFKANSIKGSAPKFSVTMLFSKDPKVCDLTPIKEAIRNAKIAKWGSKENWPDDIQSPVTDGDKPKYADKEGYKGHWAIKASTNEDQRPQVVDEDVQPIIDPSKFYPGCMARASVFAAAWDNEFGRGVSFYLDHVQKTGDAKSFGGKKPADQVFTPVNSGRRDDDDDDSGSDDDDEDFT